MPTASSIVCSPIGRCSGSLLTRARLFSIEQREKVLMKTYGRGPVDHDPQIIVELTDDQTLHCIRITLGNQSFLLHTRSALDLHHKLGFALMDWIGRSTEEVLKGMIR